MGFQKGSRLQIILACVVLTLLLAWYFRPTQTTLTPLQLPPPSMHRRNHRLQISRSERDYSSPKLCRFFAISRESGRCLA